MHTENKPVIGLTCGDINGIGLELIIKTVADSRLLEICTPVIFANNKVLNFYRKAIPEVNFNFSAVKDLSRINHKQINLYNCWEEEVAVSPGTLNDIGGKYAVLSLVAAAQALKEGKIDGLVTAPIHKKNTQSAEFNFTGHTPYLKNLFQVQDVLMFMVAENMRVGLLTEHVAVKDINQHLTKEAIISKLQLMHQSLKKDFCIDKPKIAVLGLNPHAGDDGLVGKEEEDIIRPAVKEAKQKDIFCFGPYSPDAFFARGQHEKFDGVLAMYHDQGLIPFKSLAHGEGVNYTAGLGNGVRTSPDHGVAFDIAGKNKADEASFRQAIFTCVDIIRNRTEFSDQRKNPMRKMGAAVLGRVVDERISELPE
jgi:4-hydroxythreonine-4-phosphate dehydrogenase